VTHRLSSREKKRRRFACRETEKRAGFSGIHRLSAAVSGGVAVPARQVALFRHVPDDDGKSGALAGISRTVARKSRAAREQGAGYIYQLTAALKT
jgi:hypothetical protein